MGLQLLSRYRLHNRYIENFGQGRLPCSSMQVANEIGKPTAPALQPACLILVTDGACLRHSQDFGGGSLQLQYGSQPLREFYKEPFRWDQRIFCLAVGDAPDSKQYLHPQLRALVEVTGGSHWMVRRPSALPTEDILKRLRPVLPREVPLPDPLYARLSGISYSSIMAESLAPTHKLPPGASFVNGGPICCFQALEGEDGSRMVSRRAMLLYVASLATSTVTHIPQLGNEPKTILSQPLWCVPESHFPSKKLDALPPRPAQPLLFYSKYPANLGSKSFEPMQVIKMLHKLDQIVIANRRSIHQPAKCLHRDVYVCDWVYTDADKPIQDSFNSQTEYFPVFCRGAGRPTLSDDADSFVNVGILHVPHPISTSLSPGIQAHVTTLTLLPPEPHVLLPLLLRAAEAEQRIIRKAESKQALSINVGGTSNKHNVILDDHWRSEFQAYLFRVPPYYQQALRRCLRPILPVSAHALLNSESSESVALQCFSKICLQKIRNGEQVSRDTSERLEKQEASLRRLNVQLPSVHDTSMMHRPMQQIRYGNYDHRSSVDSYLETLRFLPPPWQRNNKGKDLLQQANGKDCSVDKDKQLTALDVLGDLPASCLMAYYESRRRWLFGGTALTTRGLHVDGVSNGGSNVQRCGRKAQDREECLLSIAGVGVSSLNETSTARMGDYKERLLLSRSPIVGYGSNDATGVAATTAADGSPVWSVDDSAMPQSFFDARTGEFCDSAHARSLSKTMVNFGSPFREKRADSMIPAKFLSQIPSMRQRELDEGGTGSRRMPPGSPPQSSFESVEEGEALFATRTSPIRLSPTHEDASDIDRPPLKRLRTESSDDTMLDVAGSIIAESEPYAPSLNSLNKQSTPRPPAPPNPFPASSHPTKPTHAGATVASPKPPAPHKPAGNGPPQPRPPPPPPKKSTTSDDQVLAPLQPPPPPPQPEKEPAPHPVQAPSDLESQDPITSSGPSKEATSQTNESIASQALPRTLDYECPDRKPAVDLPLGWMSVWSKSQKRWYFFNTKTNKSLWKWPPDA